MCHTLAFFPTPYPDEDFRSLVYRYHIKVGYENFNSTCLDLFGRKLNRNLPIPINMIAFTNKLPIDCGIDMESLLNHNTYWPLLRVFLHDYNLRQSISNIQYETKTTGVNQYLKHSGILSSQIRYCPECLKEDFYKYGECFVHLSHQIDAIVVCPVHHISLMTHCPVCKIELVREDGTGLLVTPYCVNGHSLSNFHIVECNTFIAQMRLYHDVQAICKNSKKLTQKEIMLRFRLACIRKGYMSTAGFITKKKLIDDILDAIANTSSDEIGALVEYSYASSVLIKRIFSNYFTIHSLPFYIFLMYFFYGSVKELIHSNLFLTEIFQEDLDKISDSPREFLKIQFELKELLSSLDEVAATDDSYHKIFLT